MKELNPEQEYYYNALKEYYSYFALYKGMTVPQMNGKEYKDRLVSALWSYDTYFKDSRSMDKNRSVVWFNKYKWILKVL
jgi:hypothetical protein